MKNLALAFAAVFALAAFGCKKEEKKTEAPKTDTTTKPTDTTTPPPADQKPADQKPADQAAAPAAGTGDMPAACQEYAKKMESCLASDKFPAAAKDQTKQAFETMKSGWASLKGAPPESVKAAEDACTQAINGMKQGGEMMCPGVW